MIEWPFLGQTERARYPVLKLSTECRKVDGTHDHHAGSSEYYINQPPSGNTFHRSGSSKNNCSTTTPDCLSAPTASNINISLSQQHPHSTISTTSTLVSLHLWKIFGNYALVPIRINHYLYQIFHINSSILNMGKSPSLLVNTQND